MSDLQKRNAAAVHQTLLEQNTKMDEMQTKIIGLSMQVQGLVEQHTSFRQQIMQQIASSFDGGSTASEE